MDTYKFGENEDKFYEKIYEEFDKTKTDIDFYVNTLINWAKDQLHFPEIPSVDACIFFISSCKFSIEKAKSKIDMYYSIRSLIPEMFTVHPLSPEMVTHSKIAYCIPLPKVTNKNERVLYMRLNGDYEPEDFVHERWLTQVLHVLEVLTQEDKSNNIHIIFDCADQKLAHVSRFSPVLLRKFLVILEKVYSARMASIHLLNVPHYAEVAFNKLFFPLLPEKLRHRLLVDKGTGTAFEKFSKDILPKDIEGEEKSLEELRGMLYRKFEEFKPRFDKIQYMTTNESLRPTKLENDDILGYYGSFRKIDVD